MADNVFTLGVEIDSKGAVSGLKDIQKELKSTSDAAKDVGKGFGEGVDKLNGELKGLAGNLIGITGQDGIGGVVDGVAGLTRGFGLAAGAAVGITAAVGAATVALIANASAMAAAADDAAELAEMYGITTTQLAAFDLIASENSTTTAALVGTYDRLTKSISEVQDGNIKTENSFRRLGIQQSDLAGKSQQEIAGIVIKNYEALGRTVQATAAVQDILGKSFREQIPAIRAAANEYKDYEERIRGTVASKALEEAGARQEKALSDLGLAWKSLKLTMSGFFTDTVTESADWATKVAKNLNDTLTLLTGKVTLFEQFKLELEERQKLGLAGIFSSLVGGRSEEAEAAAKKRALALNAERIAAEEALAATERLRNYKGTSTAGAGRSSGIGGVLVDIPTKDEPKRLTEAERNLRSYNDAVKSSIAEINRNLAVLGQEGDVVGQKVTTLAYKLFDAGKGVKTFEEALKEAQKQQAQFAKLLELSATKKFNDDVKKINEDFEYQLQLLTATTDQQREQIRLRQQLNKAFADQPGGQPTAAQAAALEEALRKSNEQFAKLQSQRINNSVRDSLRDLAEQGADLAYEVENYWQATEYGVRDTTVALRQLYRQLDPEGRGANLSEAQKAALKGQVEFIEAQRLLLEQNRQIEDSFRDLGSAVSDWALGSKDAIKNVKLELIKLVAIQAMKAYGGTGNSFADLFIGGFIKGISGQRAEGGPVDAGKSYIVGEKRPEVFVPKQSGYIIPNVSMMNARSGQVTSITVAPNLIIHGGVTGQSELDRKFDEMAFALADQTQKLIVRQAGSSGIFRSR